MGFNSGFKGLNSANACFSLFLLFFGRQSKSGLSRLIFEVSRSHADTHNRQDSPERMISSSQRPLPTRHTTNTKDENGCRQWGFEPRDSSSQAAANLRLRPHGHRVRLIVIKFRIVCVPHCYVTTCILKRAK